MSGCVIEMICGNQTISPYAAMPVLTSLTSSSSSSSSGNSGSSISGGDSSNSNSNSISGAIGSSNSNGASANSVRVAQGIDESTLSPADRTSLQYYKTHLDAVCYTAPFVRCSEDSPWTPLWNLHVHSKHTQDYKSVPCDCPALP